MSGESHHRSNSGLAEEIAELLAQDLAGQELPFLLLHDWRWSAYDEDPKIPTGSDHRPRFGWLRVKLYGDRDSGFIESREWRFNAAHPWHDNVSGCEPKHVDHTQPQPGPDSGADDVA